MPHIKRITKLKMPVISRTGQIGLRTGRRFAGRFAVVFVLAVGVGLGAVLLKNRRSATNGGFLPFLPLMPI
jgi:hypothetical protein